MYTEYANKYSAQLATLQRLSAQTPVTQFLETLKSKARQPQKLQDILIMPIQRVPRYLLLLQDLLRNTPKARALLLTSHAYPRGLTETYPIRITRITRRYKRRCQRCRT